MLGFFRVQAVAVTLGATAAADALLLSLTVLTFFDAVFVSGAAVLTAQALYVRRHASRAGKVALGGLALSAALWTWAGLMFGGLCALGGERIAAVIAPGFSLEARLLFAHACAIASLLPATSALMVYASALNRIHGKEVLFTVNPLVINGLSWLSILVARSAGASAPDIILVFLLTIFVTTALMFVMQLCAMEKPLRQRMAGHLGRAMLPRGLPRRIKACRRELLLVWPIVGALLAQQAMTLISYAFATRAGSGFLLLFGLAERLTNVIFAVFIMTFLTVLEPRWARAAVTPGGSREIADDVSVIAIALIPLTATLIFAGDGIAIMLFGHGAVSDRDIGELATISQIYALTLPGMSLGVVFTRLLVIRNLGSRVLLVNLCITTLHMVLCYLLSAAFGASGVAAALAVSLALQAMAYGWLLVSANREGHTGGHLLARICALSLLVAGAGWLTSLLELGSLLRISLVATATLLTTVAGARLVGLDLWTPVRRLARL